MQIPKSDIRPQIKWAVSLVIAYGHFEGKGKGICLASRYPCDYTFFRLYLPWQWAHSSLQLLIQTWICFTRYPLRLGGPRQCGIPSLPDTSTHGQHWKSNPRPFGLEFNALSTWPHAPLFFFKGVCRLCMG